MATTNPITGDLMVSRVLSEKGSEAFDRIFGEKKKTNGGWTPPTVTQDPLCKICGKVLSTTKECAWTGCELNWNESRIDVISANGNDGLHYD